MEIDWKKKLIKSNKNLIEIGQILNFIHDLFYLFHYNYSKHLKTL